MRYVILPVLLLLLGACGRIGSSITSSQSRESRPILTSDSLVGLWLRGGDDLELRADGTWSSDSVQEQHYGNWHVADGKLIQTDWSGSGPFVIIWAIAGANNETLSLRLVETGRGYLRRDDRHRTYKRMPDFPKAPGPNQAMQPTTRWRTASLSMTNKLSFQTRLALTSGG